MVMQRMSHLIVFATFCMFINVSKSEWSFLYGSDRHFFSLFSNFKIFSGNKKQSEPYSINCTHVAALRSIALSAV